MTGNRVRGAVLALMASALTATLWAGAAFKVTAYAETLGGDSGILSEDSSIDASGRVLAEDGAEEPKSTAFDFDTVAPNGVVVSIHAPEGAFPAGTEPVVRPADSSALMEAASDLVEGESVDARAVDISFVYDGAEVEPAEGSSVSVSLNVSVPVAGQTFSVVHLDDDGSAEVMDGDATMFGADFEAKEFSVYGIVGSSVERGPKEEYTRLKVVFRNSEQEDKDGAIISTQIVHEGDAIDTPDVTSNVATIVRPDDSSQAVVYPTFTSWTVKGTAVDAATYFDKTLTEDDIQGFITAYGATKSSEYDNLYEVTLVADYEEGYRSYFHKYAYRSGSDAAAATYNRVILGSLATINKQVNLSDFAERYVPPTENDKLIGWRAYDMEGQSISIGGKDLFATTDTVTLSDDTDFYPVLAEGISVALEMGGATPFDNVVAVYDEATEKNVLRLEDLPNDVVTADNYYPGYTFDGWYADKGFANQITENNSATFDPGTTGAKVYAKWNANTEVSYKIAFLAEDEAGEPGEGSFTVYTTKTYTGKAGDTIPRDKYDNESIPYHHLVKEGEIDGDDLYTRSTEETAIKGDGSTVKLVYYTYNRIKLTCTQDEDGHYIDGGNNVLPNKWVKPGESIEDWLGEGGFSGYSRYIDMAYMTTGLGQKRYVEYRDGRGSSYYTFDGTQAAIPYESRLSDDETTVVLRSYVGKVESLVCAKHYYECHPEKTYGINSTVTVTVNGEEKEFYLDHDVVWGSSAPVYERPSEKFGNTAEGGGLVERAYKAADQANGEGFVHDLPEERVGNLGRIDNAYRYDTYYLDHYYVRTLRALTFDNYEGVEADKPQDQDAVMYGKSIKQYLPNYSEKTTRAYGGDTYYFVGWYTDKVAANNPDDDTSDTFKLADDAAMPASDLILYAGWRIKSHTVTFDAMGGTFAGGETKLSVSVESGKRVQRPADPARASEAGAQPYEFVGWYKDQEYTQSWDFNTDVMKGDLTLYAHWYHEKTWTIEYYEADGTKKDSWGDKFVEGAKVHLDAPEQNTYNGKPFLGWAIKVGEGDSDDDYRIVPNIFTVVDVEGNQQVIKLYARYGDAPLAGAPTVTFHSNYPDQAGEGDTTTALADPETPNGQVILPDYATLGFTRPRYHKFIGWGNTADGSDKVYAANEPVGVSGDPGETTDLYAIWEYTTYTIRFVNDDGAELQSGKVAYGETPEYAGEEPTKAEDDQFTYAFRGWEPEVTAVTGEATYTAAYDATQKLVTLTFDLAGGTLDGKTGKVTMTAMIGETVKLLGAPTRDGYTFKYWKGSQYDAGAEYKVEGDHTFTAIWEKRATPTTTSKPASTTAAKTELPKTSDTTSPILMSVLTVVGLAAVALGWCKRRQNEA